MWLLENWVTHVVCIIFLLNSVIFDSPDSHGFHRNDSVRLLYFPYLENKLVLSRCYWVALRCELPEGPGGSPFLSRCCRVLNGASADVRNSFSSHISLILCHQAIPRLQHKVFFQPLRSNNVSTSLKPFLPPHTDHFPLETKNKCC